MSKILMLKIFLRALMVVVFIVAFVVIFLQCPLLTLSALCLSWFVLMFQLDPPSQWGN
ncbi:hypothetical protein [Mucilaginibacter flavidus]|uniref:hypothetical protein n=1 Tax=Mucilaginibacter flavidus TaxID=2949309 RepID=UPI002093600F|nr:hypothetical protein [Mucilaginibacter flavidus]MCO5948027.1 hypothetical protein [Mucilaginibacter flavidus]